MKWLAVVAGLLENIKTVAELAAYVGAAAFFWWKLRSGYLIVNASISIDVARSPCTSDTDLLAVSVKLTKGSIGTLVLHDARIRVSHGSSQEEREVLGYERLKFRMDEREPQRSRVTFGHRSAAAPYLFLTPEEEATFSALMKVPSSAPCIVEAAVSGKRRYGDRIGQWRSSTISLPASAAVRNSAQAQPT